jgi:hypothetical protein
MKTIKLLLAGLLLFLAASINIASAQSQVSNDSIYGLEASVTNNIMNLSFYTTYDMKKLKSIFLATYDGSATDWSTSSYWGGLNAEYNNGSFFSHDFAEITVDSVSEDVHKINIKNTVLRDFYKNKTFKFRLFVRGDGYAPPSEALLAAGNKGRSNLLTFYPPR